jgi:hypothetical protein
MKTTNIRTVTISSIALLALLIITFAITTASDAQRWIQGSKTEFLKGNPVSTSVTSDGVITLPPDIQLVFPKEGQSLAQPFIWQLAADSKGAIYAAGGNEGIIYDIKGLPIFDADEPEIYAMAIGPDDKIYFAASPSGIVMKQVGPGTVDEFFTPRSSHNGTETTSGSIEKYVWDMVFDSAGNLFIATGIEGRVYRVTYDKRSAMVFDSELANITSLAADSNGNVYFGSDPEGQVFKRNSDGKTTVIFDSDLKEISDIAVSSDGTVYAIGVAESSLAAPKTTDGVASSAAPTNTRTGSITKNANGNGTIAKGNKSALYRITPAGDVTQLWSSASQIAYSIVLDDNNNAIIGTGPNAVLISVDNNGVEKILRSLDGEQITSLLKVRSSIYAAVSNIAALYKISSGYAAQGEFHSAVKDTGGVSDFGTISWQSSGSRVALRSRSGNTKNPDNTWSSWSKDYTDPENSKVSSPAARYIQWKAMLSTSSPAQSPELRSVSLFYAQRNLAPQIESFTVLPAGIKQLPGLGDPDMREMPAAVKAEMKAMKLMSPISAFNKSVYRQGARTLTWKANDANGDPLLYKIQIRASNSETWTTLVSAQEASSFSFDSRQLADGSYTAKVVANDSAANNSQNSLNCWLDSQPFIVDNTPPVVNDLQVTIGAGKINLSFTALDAASTVRRIMVRIDDDRWIVATPEDGIADSKEEKVVMTIPAPAAGDHSIIVKVIDELHNAGAQSASLTVR